jgi:hypothetical protein
MANRERGELALVSDGVSYTLRWTTNACAELETASGHELQHWLDQWTSRGSHIALRWLMWAGLQDRHAETVRTVQDAGRVIDGADDLPTLLVSFIALNFQPLQALIDDGIFKKPAEGEGSARPPIARASRNGSRGIAPFARPA